MSKTEQFKQTNPTSVERQCNKDSHFQHMFTYSLPPKQTNDSITHALFSSSMLSSPLPRSIRKAPLPRRPGPWRLGEDEPERSRCFLSFLSFFFSLDRPRLFLERSPDDALVGESGISLLAKLSMSFFASAFKLSTNWRRSTAHLCRVPSSLSCCWISALIALAGGLYRTKKNNQGYSGCNQWSMEQVKKEHWTRFNSQCLLLYHTRGNWIPKTRHRLNA